MSRRLKLRAVNALDMVFKMYGFGNRAKRVGNLYTRAEGSPIVGPINYNNNILTAETVTIKIRPMLNNDIITICPFYDSADSSCPAVSLLHNS